MPNIQTATHGPIDIDGMPLNSQPFLTGTPVQADNSAAAGAALTVTLAATPGVTNYLEVVHIVFGKSSTFTGLVSVTITGLLGGTVHFFAWQDSSTFTIQTIVFKTARPASAVNTAITISIGAVGGGGAPAFTLFGFQA